MLVIGVAVVDETMTVLVRARAICMLSGSGVERSVYRVPIEANIQKPIWNS